MSTITNMSNMFNYANGDFSENLSAWDVGNVTDMSSMFDQAD